jgi:radical SAM protein with 4Fe4S-binding SPASM domain
MCYIRKKAGDQQAMAEELSAKQWIELARQARDEGMLYLLLTGGEVLVRQDFFDILDGVSRLGLNIRLSTNATLLTSAIARELASYSLAQVTVTLYGASAATYKEVSGSAAAFEQTLRGLRLLKEQGIASRLRTTIVRQNAGDMRRMLEIAEELGLEFGLSGCIVGRRRDVDSDPFAVRLTPEEQLACEETYYRSWAEKTGIAPHQREWTPDVAELLPPDKAVAATNAFTACMAGHSSFTVNPDGRLCACMVMEEPSVLLLPDLNFRQGWDEIKALSDQVPVCQECQDCERKKICKPCPGRLQGESGSPSQKAPYLCRRAELLASGEYITVESFR